MRRQRFASVLLVLAAACAPAEQAAPPTDPELVAVAEQVCTVMWDWQLDVGGIMNAMSAASKVETDPEVRQMLYRDAFADARTRNAELETTISALPKGPFVDRMREDIRNGLFAAEQVITEIDHEVDSMYSTGLIGYHQVVSHIFIGFEKVIDVAKPEMADYGSPELVHAFISVAQCQHGVKDANDGRPRYVPTS
jgi:hypothetical protein